jgi:hypothetical protein
VRSFVAQSFEYLDGGVERPGQASDHGVRLMSTVKVGIGGGSASSVRAAGGIGAQNER